MPRWRRLNAEIADETEQICPVDSERARRVRAVAAVILERSRNQLPLEVGNRSAIARVIHRAAVSATTVPKLPAGAKSAKFQRAAEPVGLNLPATERHVRFVCDSKWNHTFGEIARVSTELRVTWRLERRRFVCARASPAAIDRS